MLDNVIVQAGSSLKYAVTEQVEPSAVILSILELNGLVKGAL